MRLTRKHFKFLAKEVAPMLKGIYIENGEWAKVIKEFGRNSKFQSELFTFKSKESWENVNVKPDCDPDDVGVLEDDFILHTQPKRDKLNGTNTKEA